MAWRNPAIQWKSVFPSELHEAIEISLNGEEEDGDIYISIIQVLRAADVSIFASILARQIDEYGQKMLDNLFKYKATHVLMDIIIAHQDHQDMMSVFHQISAYSDRHNRNLLHLALLFVRYDFFHFALENMSSELLPQLILQQYTVKEFTVIDQIFDHSQHWLIPSVLAKITVKQLKSFLLTEDSDYTVWLFRWDDDALELVLDFIFTEDKAFCRQIILEPPYNLLEKNIAEEQSWTVDLLQRYINTESNKRRKLC